MKLSNKLLLICLALYIAIEAICFIDLKAQYRSGNYNQPYYRFSPITAKYFDQVVINPSAEFSTIIRKGKERKIWVSEDIIKQLKFEYKANKLIINLHRVKGEDYRHWYGDTALVIYTPDLKGIETNNEWFVNNTKVGETYNAGDSHNSVSINNLNCKKLNIITRAASFLRIRNCKIDEMAANTVGMSKLRVKLSSIQNGNITVKDTSGLELEQTTIQNFKYSVSEHSSIMADGQSLYLIKK